MTSIKSTISSATSSATSSSGSRSNKSPISPPIASHRRSVSPERKPQPIRWRELPNWFLAMTFVILSASDFRLPWIFEEPLEHFTQPFSEEIPLRLTKLNFHWLRRAHAARLPISEEKVCHPVQTLPHQQRSLASVGAC